MTPAQKLRMVADSTRLGSSFALQACGSRTRTGRRSASTLRRASRCSMPARSPLATFIEPLERLGLPYCITGSVAASVYGEPRLTADIDVVLSTTRASSRRMSTSLCALRCTPGRASPPHRSGGQPRLDRATRIRDPAQARIPARWRPGQACTRHPLHPRRDRSRSYVPRKRSRAPRGAGAVGEVRSAEALNARTLFTRTACPRFSVSVCPLSPRRPETAKGVEHSLHPLSISPAFRPTVGLPVNR